MIALLQYDGLSLVAQEGIHQHLLNGEVISTSIGSEVTPSSVDFLLDPAAISMPPDAMPSPYQALQCDEWVEGVRKENSTRPSRLYQPFVMPDLLKAFGNQETGVGGWLEQGFTLNPSNPTDGLNRPMGFNDQANEYMLNQLYAILNTPTLEVLNWKSHARLDINYGYDSEFLTTRGLERHKDDSNHWNSNIGQNGLALPQFYVESTSSVYDRSSIRIGHFYSPIGMETVGAKYNALYSHSYLYLYGVPFSFSGLMATHALGEDYQAVYALTTGWDALDTSLHSRGMLFGLERFTDDPLGGAIHFYYGRDETNVDFFDQAEYGDRMLVSAAVRYDFSPRLRVVHNAVFGTQGNAILVIDNINLSLGRHNAQWYGVAQYTQFEINKFLRSTLRLEWFRDEDGSRLGIPVEFTDGGRVMLGNNYASATFGLNYNPVESIVLRPEIRFDWTDLKSSSDVPGGISTLSAFNDRLSQQQFTIGMDAIFVF